MYAVPDSAAATLRRVRGGVAGALSAVTAVGSHGAANGLASTALTVPTADVMTLLVLACAAFGAVVATLRCPRGLVSGLILIVGSGQLIGHVTLSLAGHHGAGLLDRPSTAMIGFHAAALVADVIVLRIVETAVVCALAVLHRLVVVLDGAPDALSHMWVAHMTLIARATGRRTASTAITRGPPS